MSCLGDQRAAVCPESPLAWLRQRKGKDGEPLISAEMYEAGERLRSDFWLARLSPRVTMDWSGFLTGPGGGRRSGPGQGIELRESIVAAQARVRKALEAVDTELCGILIDVCCLEQGLEAAERGHGLPQRAGKAVLQMALRSLARHYGLLPAATYTGLLAGRLRHWGSGDYRPTLEAWQGEG